MNYQGKIQNALDKNKCKTIVHVVDVSAIVQIENSFSIYNHLESGRRKTYN